MNQNKLPLVSFCIVAYKAEKYIREAIEGAFSQDYPNLEIIMSDDCSPDKTFDIMKEMAAQYSGPHKIKLNQNKENAGPREHYNTVLYDLGVHVNGYSYVYIDPSSSSTYNLWNYVSNYVWIHTNCLKASGESNCTVTQCPG